VSIKQDDIEQTLEKKTDLIVIAGGDGTIIEVMTKLPDRSVPVALLPVPTANQIRTY
jgi:diacylglycerol kinase (ATP)